MNIVDENQYEIKPELLNINPRYKMGFKLLSKEQLDNIFPTIDNIFGKFDIHRKHITHCKEYVTNNNIQYNLMFDNVFSILGSRGSGKTSVIFTISEILKNNIKYQQDIVLPVIIPEIIPDRTDIMGWILTILEDEVTKIELEIKNNRNYSLGQEDSFFENCRFKQDNILRKRFEDVKKSFFSSREDSFRSDSFTDSINRSANKTKNGYQFSKNLSLFWDELCRTQKMLYQSKEESLIYIIFDDVDLTPHIVEKLFSAIMKYLAYPNIIVIFTADEQLLEQVIYQKIEREYYDKYNFPNIIQMVDAENDEYDPEEGENDELVKGMAEAYMNKVIPPSSRYYVLNFDECAEKKELIHKIENGKIINVENFLENQINNYIEKVDQHKTNNDKNSFLYYKNEFIESYLTFFGTTCRQIMNECLMIENFLGQLAADYSEYKIKGNIKRYQNEMFLQIQVFIKNTLKNLNHDWYNNDFLKQSFYFEKENWRFYIDYDYIRQYYTLKLKKEKSVDKISEIVKRTIQVYHLYFFIENVLMLNEEYNDKKARTRVHGQRMLVRMLDEFPVEKNSLIKLEENDKKLREFLYTYKDILENPEFLRKYNENQYYYVRQYLNLYKYKTEDDKLENKMKKWRLNHPRWCKSFIKAITLGFSGAFCLDETDFFSYDRVSEMDLFGKIMKQYMHKIKNGFEKVIKDRVKCDDEYVNESSKEDIQEKIEGKLEEIEIELNEIRYYTIRDDEVSVFKKMIERTYEIGERYEELFMISHQMKDEMEEEQKNNGKINVLKIKKNTLQNFKEIVRKSYKIASKNTRGYFEGAFSRDCIILLEILDALNGQIDFKLDDDAEKKLNKYIDDLVELNAEYIRCKIKEMENNEYPESLQDLKMKSKKKKTYVYKIYEIIQSAYNITDKKTFEKYISNIVNETIETYINKLIDDKAREI